MKEAHKRNRNPKYKGKVRVTHWPEYDRSLRNRGDITLWFSEDAIQAWAPMHNGKQGRPQKFSDLAIETVLSRRSHSLKPILFHRARAVEPVHLIVDSTGLSIHGEGP